MERFQQMEDVHGALLFARVLSRVSASRGRSFAQELVERFSGEIHQYVDLEANVQQIASWLRNLRICGPELLHLEAGKTVLALVEATKYDSRLWHFLEAAEALIECDRQDEARFMAEQAILSARRGRLFRSLKDFIVVLQKAVRIEVMLPQDGFVAQLFSRFDTEALGPAGGPRVGE